MIRIYTHTKNETESQSCYGAFLKGAVPKEGWILVEGPHLYLFHEKPSIPEEEALPVSSGPVDWIFSSLPEEKARAAYTAFLSGRRLPAGSALAAGDGKIVVFPSNTWEPDLGIMDIYHLPFDPLEEVWTPQEIAKLYGIDAKRVQSDCEWAGEGGLFAFSEVRKSGTTWLILKSAALRVYRNEKSEKLPLNPLLLVFSTIEAARIWNRDSNAVRSAAAGAGHAAARMHEGDRRKSGRTWLVTRDAMDRLFGQALPGPMKEAMKWM